MMSQVLFRQVRPHYLHLKDDSEHCYVVGARRLEGAIKLRTR